MKKSTKGALAAGAAAVLLTGGVGSLAYWSDSATTDGVDIATGHLDLTDGLCAGWQLDGGTAFTDQLLVPGDSLTQSCTYELDIAGEHFSTADFTVTVPSDLTGAAALLAELDAPSVAVALNGTAQGTATGVAVVDGDEVTVDVTITWPYGVEDNDSNAVAGLSAALDDITVAVKQNHS